MDTNSSAVPRGIQYRFSRTSRIREEIEALRGASLSVMKGLRIGDWIALMKLRNCWKTGQLEMEQSHGQNAGGYL